MQREKIAQLAADFWRRAGHEEPFPRSLEAPVIWALPIAIVKCKGLRLSKVLAWLSDRKLRIEVDLPDRDLRACLLAHGGRGLLFVDDSDPDDERRFSVAHECAHFVLDYLGPRTRAFAALGPSAAEVLDGLRPASPAEQLSGILRGVQAGPYKHLMQRTESGEVADLRTLRAEDLADQLALELLAPWPEAMSRLRQAGIRTSVPAAPEQTVRLLAKDFGLPTEPARAYARILLGRLSRRKSFKEWLGG